MIKRKNRTVRRIAVSIIAAMIAVSPAYVCIPAVAAEEESADDKGEKKQEKDKNADATEDAAEGGTQGSTEAASTEEPKDTGTEEPGKEEPSNPETSVREALDNERAMVADEDILLVRIGYEFDDGSFDEWMRGTGFIVGPRYILTRQSLIDTASDSALFARILKERGEAYKRVGVNLMTAEEAAKQIRYFVSDREGNRIEVSDSSMKSGLGLIVTKKAMDIPACVFAKMSVDDLAEGTVVHAKTAADTGEQFTVRAFDGKVYIDEEQTAGFAFQMDTQGGAPIGAPVYDDNGHVIGLIASDSQELTSYSEKALEAFLSMNGVDFRSSEQMEAEKEAQRAEETKDDLYSAEMDAVDKTLLEEAITRASAADLEEYTEESSEALREALERAKDVDVRDDASQDEVDEALRVLEAAYEGLTAKGKFSGISEFLSGHGRAILTIAAVFLGVLVAAAVMFRKEIIRTGRKLRKVRARNDKEIEDILRERDEEEIREYEYADDEFADMTRREKDRSARIPRDMGGEDLEYADEDDLEEDRATDLEEDGEDGSSDTTVLTRKAYLIRIDNGRKIPISKKDFAIGKEKSKVDYCISGDTTVSRVHALIRNIGGKYYIEDQASTNYTYYEGKQIPEYKPVCLKDGSRFKLSEVEFEFHSGGLED